MSSRQCPNCQLVNLAEAAQCTRCGYPLSEAGTASAAYAPGDLAARPYGAAQQGDAAWSFAPGEAATLAPAAPGGGPLAQEATPMPYVGAFADVGAALGRAWDIYIRNFGLIAKLVLFAAVPFALGQAAVAYRLGDAGATSAGVIVNTFVFWLVRWSLIPPAVLYAVTNVLRTGRAPGVGESYQWAAGRWLRVLVTMLLSTLLVMVGCLALFVPGIMVAVVYSLVIPVVMFEGRYWASALRRSAELTRGHRGSIFGAMFVIWLALTIVNVCTNVVATAVAAAAGASGLLLSSTIATVLGELLNQLWWMLMLVIYLGRLTPVEQAHAVNSLGKTQPAA